MNGPTEEHVDETTETTEFESYFDSDSGEWSLRRIPSQPPAGEDKPAE